MSEEAYFLPGRSLASYPAGVAFTSRRSGLYRSGAGEVPKASYPPGAFSSAPPFRLREAVVRGVRRVLPLGAYSTPRTISPAVGCVVKLSLAVHHSMAYTHAAGLRRSRGHSRRRRPFGDTLHPLPEARHDHAAAPRSPGARLRRQGTLPWRSSIPLSPLPPVVAGACV